MDDLISRQAAIDALKEKVFHNLTDEFYGTMQVLDELPPVDAVPVRRGKWIYHRDEFDGDTAECSVCHVEGMLYGNYCPNCGADMRRRQEGEKE